MATVVFTSPPSALNTRALASWLFAVAGLVFLMVVVGGITRLTESGLSITEWQPIKGALPPLSEAAWLVEFEKYKRVPQYEAIHASMTLGQFQFIYFWEWVHRLLGRVIGLAFALPLLWFWLRGAIPGEYKVRLVALLSLGGLQGAIGWWMVTSGLWQGVAVSHYRLSVHLCMALFILAGLVWTALDLRRYPVATARLQPMAIIVSLILFVQLVVGAWVAGMDAGKVAQTWPLMGDSLVPEGAEWGFTAFADNAYTTHFVHRWFAFVALVALLILARRVKRSGNRAAAVAIHASVGVQILLGIATVMSGVAIALAVLHQAVGALVVASCAWGAHAIGRTDAKSPS
jgi:heme a synthase